MSNQNTDNPASITDSPEMEEYIEKATDLFCKMVVPPKGESPPSYRPTSCSQSWNAAMALMEEMHALVATYQAKVENGEFYEMSVIGQAGTKA